MKKIILISLVFISSLSTLHAESIASAWENSREEYESLLCNAIRNSYGEGSGKDVSFLMASTSVATPTALKLSEYSKLRINFLEKKTISSRNGYPRMISIPVYPRITQYSQQPFLRVKDSIFQKDLARNRIANSMVKDLIYKWDDPYHLNSSWKLVEVREETFAGTACYRFELTQGLFGTHGKIFWVEKNREVILAEDEINEQGVLISRTRNIDFIELDSGTYIVSAYRRWLASSPFTVSVHWITAWSQEDIDDFFFSEEYLASLI